MAVEVFFILAFAFTLLQIPFSFRWQVGIVMAGLLAGYFDNHFAHTQY